MPFEFRPRLVPTLAAVAAIALTLHLAQWQRGREQEKLELQALLDARGKLPPHKLEVGKIDGEALRYRKVLMTGEYVAAKQIYLDNKDFNGKVGYHVVTPFRLSGADAHVMVNRGWIARGRDYPNPPAAPPPAGSMDLEGTATLPPRRFLELSETNVQGNVWQNLTFDRARRNLDINVLPLMVLAAKSPPGLQPVVEAPDAGAEKHRGYAFQWLALSVAVFIVWLVVNIKRSNHEKR
jgi:surfeit locus 1 family protein